MNKRKSEERMRFRFERAPRLQSTVNCNALDPQCARTPRAQMKEQNPGQQREPAEFEQGESADADGAGRIECLKNSPRKAQVLRAQLDQFGTQAQNTG